MNNIQISSKVQIRPKSEEKKEKDKKLRAVGRISKDDPLGILGELCKSGPQVTATAVAEPQAPATEQILMRPIAELSVHPQNAEIYGTESVDDLVDSIRKVGILNYLTITQDGRIVSGERRYRAALIAGLTTVPVRIFHSTDEYQKGPP